jgi:hypothetical protein
VLGQIHSRPLGAFVYEKRRSSGRALVRAEVYVIEVTSLLETWPEQSERKRAWFTLKEAASIVSDHELRDLLRAFSTK